MDDCLVYFFTGFLDSGKTSVICSWMDGDNFNDKKIVVISTEEGEEEYIKDNYPSADPVIINCETDEVNKDMTFDIERKYRPDVIFIEWNGSVSPSEFFEKVDVPRRWALAAAIVVVDTSTYKVYYKNMQMLFADYFRYSDTVIFNRVDPQVDDIMNLRGSVKSVNPAMSINFLDKDNNIIRMTEHLPYDLSKDPCDIAADDFGLFFTDAIDNADRYDGKRVSLIGRATLMREFKGQAFALERQAYTCCAADIGVMAILCLYQIKPGFPKDSWVKVTGTVKYYSAGPGGDNEPALPCLEVESYALTSPPQNEVIYFN
ncbi:MAG: hypothetical protein J6X33_02135 [Clostridiales bacterium]|nr:hypothetical protein [Clostridiales bacterium]